MTQQASKRSVFPARITPYIDVAAYVLDSRAPAATLWLDDSLCGKELIVLTRSGQADARITPRWKRYFKAAGYPCLTVDSKSGDGFEDILDYLGSTLKLKEKLAQERGILNPILRLVALGVPNVGKSSFLNRLVGGKRMRTGDAPGVTKGPQWVRVFGDVEVLDTPGILRDARALNRRKLYWQLLNLMPYDEELTEASLNLLLDKLGEQGRGKVEKFYKLPKGCLLEADAHAAMVALAVALGKKGGNPAAQEFAARRLIRDFQLTKLGRYSLERPGQDLINSPHFRQPPTEANDPEPCEA